MRRKKVRPKAEKKKSRKEAERYILQEIETFDFKLLKYFGGHKASSKLIKKLQKRLKEK